MNLLEQIKSAFSNVFANKMRTFLTMLGIIIGISSVIMITSIGVGIKSMMNKEFSKIGSNLIFVYLNYWDENVKDTDYLTLEDIDLVKTHPNLDFVAPIAEQNAKVKLRNNNLQVCNLTGTTSEYKKQGGMELAYGRFLNNSDNISGSNVAIIDELLAKQIFGYTNVVGKTIEIELEDFDDFLTIVGVIKSSDGEIVSSHSSIEVFVPIKKVFEYSQDDNEDTFTQFYAGLKDTNKINETCDDIIKLLSISHNTNESAYLTESYQNQVSIITKSINAITAFISFVAAISLLVGGIGVMNIMLVTVTERTKEIGIRKSLGATNSNIRTQFLIEAIILSLTGGFIGVVFGYLGSLLVGIIISLVAQIEFVPMLSAFVVILVVIISTSIGIIFGVYPAMKAAKLDPIDALRYE